MLVMVVAVKSRILEGKKELVERKKDLLLVLALLWKKLWRNWSAEEKLEYAEGKIEGKIYILKRLMYCIHCIHRVKKHTEEPAEKERSCNGCRDSCSAQKEEKGLSYQALFSLQICLGVHQ